MLLNTSQNIKAVRVPDSVTSPMVDAGILLSSTLQRSVSILILLSLPELLHLMKTAVSFATA